MTYHKVLDPNGFPIEQAQDVFSRKDDLLVLILQQLRLLTGVTPPPGGGTVIIPPSPEIADNLRIATVPLGLANTEVAFRFPTGTKQVTMHARNGNAVRVASEQGKVAASNDPYFTLKASTVFGTDNFLIPENNAVTWYFSCAVANEVIEMIIGD